MLIVKTTFAFLGSYFCPSLETPSENKEHERRVKKNEHVRNSRMQVSDTSKCSLGIQVCLKRNKHA